MKRKTILLSLMIAFFYTCSSHKKADKLDSQGAGVLTYENFEKGKVIEKVSCKSDTNQSYALYLPLSYTMDKKFPVIYAFDASARGSYPLKKYKSLAEKYGYILIGSNNSKNKLDWNTIDQISKGMMEDTRSRISIDEKRIYTTGFSGGARVATSIAISTGQVNGVIGCAAGFPSLDKPLQNTFNYFAIAGNEDFNYLELVSLDKSLDKIPMRHFFLDYDGIHGWAPKEIFEKGILWCEFNAMRDKLIAVNDSLIKSFLDQAVKEISKIPVNDPVALCKEYKMITSFLGDLTDLSVYKNKMDEISKSKELSQEQFVIENSYANEQKLQNEDMQALSGQDLNWWKNRINTFNQLANNSPFIYDKHMYRRLLNQIGLMTHLSYENALKNGDERQAIEFLEIKQYVQPDEPITSYLFASYYAMKRQQDKALSYLERAVNLGFDDEKQINSDGNFSFLLKNPKFIELCTKIKVNNK